MKEFIKKTKLHCKKIAWKPIVIVFHTWMFPWNAFISTLEPESGKTREKTIEEWKKQWKRY